MNIKNAQSLWGGIPAVTWESASVKGDAISEQWTRVPAYLTQYWFPSQHIIRKSPGSPPGVWIVRVKWKRLCHILSLYFKHDLHWIRMKCWGREKGERSAQWHAEPRWAVCIRIYIGFCASMVIPHHCEPLFPGPMPAEEKIKIESRPSTVRRKKDNHTQLSSTEWGVDSDGNSSRRPFVQTEFKNMPLMVSTWGPVGVREGRRSVSFPKRQ